MDVRDTSISTKIFNQLARKMLHACSVSLSFVTYATALAIRKSFLVLHIPNKHRVVSINGIARLHVAERNERSFR